LNVPHHFRKDRRRDDPDTVLPRGCRFDGVRIGSVGNQGDSLPRCGAGNAKSGGLGLSLQACSLQLVAACEGDGLAEAQWSAMLPIGR